MRRVGTPLGLRCRPLQTSYINDSNSGCDASRMRSHAAHGNEKNADPLSIMLDVILSPW